MKPSKLVQYLEFEIKNKFPVLIKGKPGIGKTDIVMQVAANTGMDVILDHPVVSDPTDFKGLPFQSNGVADFLPYRNLRKAIEAKVPTIFFLDDLGQATDAVQKAVMQLLLARQIGEHKISDHVTFVAATNRKEDKAGVTGILEPVKSRFRGGIVELEVDSNDWVKWALNEGNMPLDLIAFIRFKPDIIDQFKPTKDIENYASPRTIASVGMNMNAGLPEELENEVFKGIAGSAFATEFRAFLNLKRNLPSIDDVIRNPTGAKLPTSAGAKYALCAGLANRASDVTLSPIITYVGRMEDEFSVACILDAVNRKPELQESKAYLNWYTDKQDVLNI